MMRINRSEWLQRKLLVLLCLSLLSLSISACKGGDSVLNMLEPAQSKSIIVVNEFPNMPRQYSMLNWRDKTRHLDALLFDYNRTGDYLPLIWEDKTHYNLDENTFGIVSYAGHLDQSLEPRDGKQEAITVLSALVGASLVGIDKSDQNGRDFMKMAQTFFNQDNGLDLVLNHPDDRTGNSYWYEIYPNILFFMLVEQYPDVPGMKDIMKTVANRWYDAIGVIAASQEDGEFRMNQTSFQFENDKPIINGIWREPDAAAGIAWIMMAAYEQFGDEKYLDAAKQCMDFLNDLPYNPYYEVLVGFAPAVAARLNAEFGTNYNVGKMVDWAFAGNSAVRDGWGVVNDTWGDYDVHGLIGNIYDGGGYAFAMNTFASVSELAPLVRYDSRFAHDLGKWILHAVNNARLFYADALPAEMQSSSEWTGDPEHLIAYEGLRKEWMGISPYITGDAVSGAWAKTDFGIYGSAHVGMLGGIIQPTNVEGLLQIDVRKTDFFGAQGYETYLYYNPHDTTKSIEIDTGNKPVRLFDTVRRSWIAEGKFTGKTTFNLEPDTAAVVMLLPAKGNFKLIGSALYYNELLLSGLLPTINVEGADNGSLVSGELTLRITADIAPNDEVKILQVWRGDVMKFESTKPDALFTLDTTDLPNGPLHLSVRLTTKKGQDDRVDLKLLIRN